MTCCIDYNYDDEYIFLNDFLNDVNTVRSIYDSINADIFKTIYKFIYYFYERRNDSKLIMMGNGGSASDADHIVGEFRNRYIINRSPVNAISLSNSISTITAIGNDFNFDEIYSRQLSGILRNNDSLIALTTSGKSKNILKVSELLKDRTNINSLVITGDSNNSEYLNSLSGFKHKIIIPVLYNRLSVARIQECTMFILHYMCKLFDMLILSNNSQKPRTLNE